MGIETTEKSKKQEPNKPACQTHRGLYLDSSKHAFSAPDLWTNYCFICVVVVTWERVICLKYMYEHEGAAQVQVRIFQANHSCP